MAEKLFVKKKIDWKTVPTVIDIEKANSKYMDSKLTLIEVDGNLTIKATPRKTAKPFKYQPNEYVVHKTKDIKKVKKMYIDCGFETKVILQDPFGHPWPSAVCPIGFPFAFPKIYPELRRYSRWICRAHVEIGVNDAKTVVSIPHIEPDPCFHAAAHLIDTYIKGNVVRGTVAVEILTRLIVPV